MNQDELIKKDVLAALVWDSRINAKEIKIDVRDGLVILSGSVESLAEKKRAEKDIRKVRGVKDVSNNLIVKPTVKRSDNEITEHLKNVFTWDPFLDERTINVYTENGVVTLTGNVRTMAQKRAAEIDAWWVAGVVDVVNNITVTYPEKTTDNDLRKTVLAALQRDVLVHSGQIEVYAKDGIITLRGIVKSLIEKNAAENDAWYTPGVVDVINELKVE